MQYSLGVDSDYGWLKWRNVLWWMNGCSVTHLQLGSQVILACMVSCWIWRQKRYRTEWGTEQQPHITHKTGHRNGQPPSTAEIPLYECLSLFAGPVVGAISRQLPKVSRLLRAARGLLAGPVPKPCEAGQPLLPEVWACGWPWLPPCHQLCSSWGFTSHSSASQILCFILPTSGPGCSNLSLVAYPWASKLNQCILRKSLELSLLGSAISSLQELASHCIKRCWGVHHLQLLIKEEGDFLENTSLQIKWCTLPEST